MRSRRLALPAIRSSSSPSDHGEWAAPATRGKGHSPLPGGHPSAAVDIPSRHPGRPDMWRADRLHRPGDADAPGDVRHDYAGQAADCRPGHTRAGFLWGCSAGWQNAGINDTRESVLFYSGLATNDSELIRLIMAGRRARIQAYDQGQRLPAEPAQARQPAHSLRWPLQVHPLFLAATAQSSGHARRDLSLERRRAFRSAGGPGGNNPQPGGRSGAQCGIGCRDECQAGSGDQGADRRG